MNSVKLYSNGTAVVEKDYQIGQELKLSIPVKKSDLDDVVSSISVYGNVNLPVPPSYTPVNAQDTKLHISPEKALKDTIVKMAGSKVRIERYAGTTVNGTLSGAHTYEETNANGMTAERLKIVVLTDAGVVTIDEQHINTIKFTDERDQQEYEKALRKTYQTIKPDSSFIDLTIVPVGDEKKATVSYAVPVAAWKNRYQLRFLKGKAELVGQAVVDNDTDDDWKDSIISVITGEPITFATDLAEIRRPARSRINVVKDTAQGAVTLTDTVNRQVTRGYGGGAKGQPVRLQALTTCDSGPAFPGDDAQSLQQLADGTANFNDEVGGAWNTENYSAVLDPDSYSPRAGQQQAEVRDSGDFSVFTSPTTMNVGSKKSAIIPMFRAELAEAKSVLVYKAASDPKRPFRAVKMKNETLHSLGRGVCEVSEDGDFQGKCILEGTKPGEEVFLIHAKETGVKIHRDESPVESRRVAIKIKEGAAYCEQSSTGVIAYTVTNNKNEAFDLEIEHPRRLPNSSVRVQGEVAVAETATGWRLSVKLAAKAEISVTVTEDSLQQTVYALGNNGPLWLQQNVIAVKNPLMKKPAVLKVLELQGEVEKIGRNIAEVNNSVRTLKDDQERLLKLIPAGHQEQSNAWKKELGDNETTLRDLQRDKLPRYTRDLTQAQDRVREAVADLTASWSEKDKEPGVNGKRKIEVVNEQ